MNKFKYIVSQKNNMFLKKVPLYFVIIAFLLPASGLIFFMLDEKKSDSDTDSETDSDSERPEILPFNKTNKIK